MKMIKVSEKLLKDIYNLLCSSSKIDWDDTITTRLEKVLQKNNKEEK